VRAPAISTPGVAMPRAGRGRALIAAERMNGLIDGLFRAQASLVYAFLYLPIVVVVVFAFNANRLATIWTGFTTDWFGIALNDAVVTKSLGNSAIIAFSNAILATTFGTMAALGLQRVGKRTRQGFDILTYISIIVPEIVIALATLVFFATTFDIVNPVLSGLQGGGKGGFKLGFGQFTIVAAHVLFNTSLVLLLVRARLSGMDRTLVEASQDLFATPWRTFRQITFPQLLPAIVAGFLLSFTFAFDDYLITTFVNGRGTSTLPLYVFSQIRRGVTPSTNAVAAIMLLVTLGLLIGGQWFLTRSSRKSGGGAAGGVVGIVTEQSGG
jgi:spermidine/putrescine transport system permease protein